MKREMTEFPSGKFVLRATWDWPDGTPPPSGWPGVVFCHGFTGNRIESKRAYARLGALLAGQGIASFRFDHRGCGESDGEFHEFSAHGIQEDLEAVYEEFSRNPLISKVLRGAVGYSLGGPSACYIAAKKECFRTVVLWAPVARPDIIKERFSKLPGFETYESLGYYDTGGYRVTKGYLDFIGSALQPLEWAAGFTGPLLVCHGGADEIVKPEQAELYLRARNNPADRKIIVPGADHGFSSADLIDGVIRQSYEWLLEYLKPS